MNWAIAIIDAGILALVIVAVVSRWGKLKPKDFYRYAGDW
jgi:hypothetical protein